MLSVRELYVECLFFSQVAKLLVPRTQKKFLEKFIQLSLHCQKYQKVFQIEMNYSGTPPYDHLVITANFFRPVKTIIHFLIKIPR